MTCSSTYSLFIKQLSQIKKRLGCTLLILPPFKKNSSILQYTYNPTFHDVYKILSNDLLPKEHGKIWNQSRAYADEIHQTNATQPVPARFPNRTIIPREAF